MRGVRRADIIEIGQKLIDVKQRLGHGRFGEWLQVEFAWSEASAQRFMRVAERFQNRQIDGFAPSALYMLASPSVADEARDEAIRAGEAGERITVTKARAIVDQYRPEASASADDDELKAAALAWARGIWTATRPRCCGKSCSTTRWGSATSSGSTSTRRSRWPGGGSCAWSCARRSTR